MILAIIPVRYASSRFPGKPLALIHGKPMIQRVHEQAMKCVSLNKVIVATDDERIEAAVNEFGGEVIITSSEHQSGTERCAEVISKVSGHFSVVINIQGDEPFVFPEQVELLCSCFQNQSTQIATLIKRITRNDELFNPNVVKVVRAENGDALYFSRSSIPHHRDVFADYWVNMGIYYRHLGIYGYRKEVLEAIVKLPMNELEKAESLEQLRWLTNGFRIQTAITDLETISIDTAEDLQRAEKFHHEK